MSEEAIAQEIAARLQSEVAALREVQGIAQLVLANDLPAQPPAAYVYPLGVNPGRNALVTALDQRVQVQIGVLFAVRNLRDAVGLAAMGDMAPVKAAARTALLNWLPASADDPLELGIGKMLSLTNQVLWWQDTYLTSYHLRAS